MKNLYLIKRGPKPTYHNAPFFPVIICDIRRVALEESEFSGDKATVWTKDGWDDNGHGWLIVQWNGLMINYGGLVRGFDLPDGTSAGFYREYEDKSTVKDLFAGAVWWSNKKMPEWLKEKGVIYPPDDFTQLRILDSVANDSTSGCPRPIPKHWK